MRCCCLCNPSKQAVLFMHVFSISSLELAHGLHQQHGEACRVCASLGEAAEGLGAASLHHRPPLLMRCC